MDVKIIDLTRGIHDGSETYPGDHAGLVIERLADVEDDGYNLSRFRLEAHCGTHIDAPSHFIAGGADVSSLPLTMPKVTLIDAAAGMIGPDSFPLFAPLAGRAVLIRTGWDARIGRDDYYLRSPYLIEEAAKLLVKSGAALLGIDFPSPDPFGSDDYPVHHALLGAGIPIVEGLVGLDRLLQIPSADIYFAAFPLRAAGLEASPVRAAAIIISSRSSTAA